MTAIDPSNVIFFFYNPNTGEVPFSTVEPALFFDAAFDPQSTPPFIDAVNIHDIEYITKEWRSCLLLKENESRHFSFKHSSSGPNLVFDCSALGVVLSSLSGLPGLLVHVKKSTAPATSVKSAPNYQKDYAEFIELAGHDLDAPLRKMSVLIERLVAKIDVSGEVAGYITRIQASLGDMRNMLDGLSTLAAFTPAEVRTEDCHLDRLLQGIMESWPASRRERVKVKGVLPVLKGDRKQFRELFTQLIENALLFTNPEHESIVTVSETTLNDEEYRLLNDSTNTPYAKIIVEDNGVGFREEYAEKIFKPFVRLHGKSEYPGHGMGLAICKRIVENHEGMIRAESNSGAGARFILILPQTIT